MYFVFQWFRMKPVKIISNTAESYMSWNIVEKRVQNAHFSMKINKSWFES